MQSLCFNQETSQPRHANPTAPRLGYVPTAQRHMWRSTTAVIECTFQQIFTEGAFRNCPSCQTPNKTIQLNLPGRFHCVNVSVAWLPGVPTTDTVCTPWSRAPGLLWVPCSSSAWGRGGMLCPCMRLLFTKEPSTCIQLGTIGGTLM
jgi:hypothetical protein